MSDEKKPIDFSYLGGRKSHHFVPEKSAKEISIEHIGGRRVGGHIAPPEEPVDESNSATAAVKSADKLSGRFAEFGGIERHSAHEFEKPEKKPIDLSSVGGKVVRHVQQI